MSNFISASGSVRIVRLRSGENVVISLYPDRPLYQSISPDSHAIAPDWTIAAEQPTIIPECYSSKGNAIKIVDFEWRYNGSLLEFGAMGADGWAEGGIGYKTNPSVLPRFRACFQATNAGDKVGALRIISNLASPTNTANDSLAFMANLEVDGQNQREGNVVDVLIQPMGASAYIGLVEVSPSNTFTSDINSITLTPTLMLGSSAVSNYTVKWYKNTDPLTTTGNVLTVTRADVAGAQLYVAEFVVDGNVVSRYGLVLTDITDEFRLAWTFRDSATKAIVGNEIGGANDSIDVTAKVVDRDGNDFTLPPTAKWVSHLMSHDTWQEIRSVQSNTITVTAADTMQNGLLNDVEVYAEVNA